MREWVREEEEHEDDDINTKQQVREEPEVVEEKLESLLQALLVFCFKHNLPIKDFVDLVCSAANSHDVSLENLPSYVKHLEIILQSLKEEIKDKIIEKQLAR